MSAHLTRPPSRTLATRTLVFIVLAGLAGAIVGLACAVVFLALWTTPLPANARWRGARLLVASIAISAWIASVCGSLLGLWIGFAVNPPTAAAASVELSTIAGVGGGVLGSLVGLALAAIEVSSAERD